MLFWIYDKNKYYSSTENKYLMIDSNDDNLNDTQLSIKLGFDISLHSDRILILPKIPCKLCNEIKYNTEYCNYITFFNLRELNNKIGEEKFRENV